MIEVVQFFIFGYIEFMVDVKEKVKFLEMEVFNFEINLKRMVKIKNFFDVGGEYGVGSIIVRIEYIKSILIIKIIRIQWSVSLVQRFMVEGGGGGDELLIIVVSNCGINSILLVSFIKIIYLEFSFSLKLICFIVLLY